MTKARGFLHGFASEHVLNVGDRAGGVHERAAGQDGDALLGRVEHLLNVWQDSSDVW